MISFRTTMTDITSNARVKEYPTKTVLQVANAPIFRAPGFEPRKRTYDVPPKGKGLDPERALESSRARAVCAVRDIALCNSFEYFFTLTLSPELIDRYDVERVKKTALTFLKNASSRKGFQYIFVVERHEDGALHFHGLCNLGSVQIVRACDPHTGRVLSTKHGQPIFNMLDWTWGFSTCIPIDENYDRTCNYITKYISKGQEKIFGKWYYSSRNLKKRPDISLITGGMDYDTFHAENPDLPEVQIYLDVCMTSLQIGKEAAPCPTV